MAYDEEQLCDDARAVSDWRKDGCIRPLSNYLKQTEFEIGLDNQNKIDQNRINQAVDAFFDGITKGIQ